LIEQELENGGDNRFAVANPLAVCVTDRAPGIACASRWCTEQDAVGPAFTPALRRASSASVATGCLRHWTKVGRGVDLAVTVGVQLVASTRAVLPVRGVRVFLVRQWVAFGGRERGQTRSRRP
jgi:hypothetical protein